MDNPQTAKIVRNGRSITKVGGKVILSEKPDSWEDFFSTGHKIPVDFLSRRKDTPPQKRKLFK